VGEVIADFTYQVIIQHMFMTKTYELNQGMLNAHLRVSINGPDSDTRAANEIIGNTKRLAANPRRKLLNKMRIKNVIYL